MTEKEAIEQLEDIKNPFARSVLEAEIGDEYALEAKEDSENALKALDIAIKALEEIQQYRAVGSVEECWEAVEMRKEKKPKLNNKRFLGKDTYTCPRCGNVCLTKYANERQNNNFCWDCGQAIDWSEEE